MKTKAKNEIVNFKGVEFTKNKVNSNLILNAKLANNQFISSTPTQQIFTSYTTIVCVIDKRDGSILIAEGQPQSKTTKKYLNQFLSLFTNFTDYKQVKN